MTTVTMRRPWKNGFRYQNWSVRVQDAHTAIVVISVIFE